VYRRSAVNLDGDVAMANVECTDGDVLPPSRRMAFRWKQIDGPPLFNTSFPSVEAYGLFQAASFTRYLSIPAQTLAANTDYTFELTATLTGNVALTGKSTAVVRVRWRRSGLRFKTPTPLPPVELRDPGFKSAPIWFFSPKLHYDLKRKTSVVYRKHGWFWRLSTTWVHQVLASPIIPRIVGGERTLYADNSAHPPAMSDFAATDLNSKATWFGIQ
jgi:hypothetical protein